MTAGFPDDATIEDLERRLTIFFRHRLSASADVRDLVAEVILTLPNFRGEGSLKNYAFSVARKQFAEHLRKRYGRSLDTLPTGDALAVEQVGLSTQLDRERRAAIVRSAVAEIEAPYGEVVRLRLSGLDPKEIAAQIGVHYHTVRSRLARGFERLRERLVEVLGTDRPVG